MKTALLVIDIQKDHFPGGKQELVKPLEAAQKAYMLLQCFREHGGKHVHIQHISQTPDAGYFISGDRGTDIHDSVAHFEGEPIVYKHHPNAFLDTELLTLLKSWEIERLVITGMMTHLDVDATARAAADLGFEVGAVRAHIGGKDAVGARAIGAKDHGDRLVGQGDTGVIGGDFGVVPFGDLP